MLSPTALHTALWLWSCALLFTLLFVFCMFLIFSFRASEEDRQSFVMPSSGDGSSLNLSGLVSDEDVNEQSISEVLNFNANLTQAAEKMSCRQLAALLATQSWLFGLLLISLLWIIGIRYHYKINITIRKPQPRSKRSNHIQPHLKLSCQLL